MKTDTPEIPGQYNEAWLDDLDRRTSFARGLHQREADVLADLGGASAVSYAQRSLVRRALFLEVLIRRAESRIAEGETLDKDELGRLTQMSNALLGVWKALGLQRQRREVPDLQDYLRRREGAQA